MARKAINELLPGKLYQRAQILSWPLEDKVKLVKDLNIGIVINFWPKLDPDMSSLPCWYYYMPSSSEQMLDDNVILISDFVSTLLAENCDMSALILCEAGKTRSVFFASLLYKQLTEKTGRQVLKDIDTLMPGHHMKPYMHDFLSKLK